MIETADLEALRRVLAGFVTDEVSDAAAYGAGHIHDTFLVRAGSQQLIVQRFNEQVFTDIDAVMSNVARVTEHARERLAQRGVADLERRVLRVRRTRTGETYVRDAHSRSRAAFRVFDYVTASRSLRTTSDERMTFEAARAFGEFVAGLRDLPAPALAVTIPGFHDTAARLSAWRSAYASDPLGRARELEAEWTFIEQHAELAQAASRCALPLRVTHNDAKLDNVLFDAHTPQALCVVDLDTVMPGYLAYDFGDLVRTTACVGDEDSRDLSRSGLRLGAFEALARGYLQEVAGFLEPTERDTLADGALWILLELGLRFLTDHVLGDGYFKIARPNHNLDRARVQLHLVGELERELDVLRHVCARSG